MMPTSRLPSFFMKVKTTFRGAWAPLCLANFTLACNATFLFSFNIFWFSTFILFIFLFYTIAKPISVFLIFFSSVIRSVIRSSIRSAIKSAIRSVVHSAIRCAVRSVVRSVIRSWFCRRRLERESLIHALANSIT